MVLFWLIPPPPVSTKKRKKAAEEVSDFLVVSEMSVMLVVSVVSDCQYVRGVSGVDSTSCIGVPITLNTA